MKYAILRTAKIKSVGGIAGSLTHNYRTAPTPNADSERTHMNYPPLLKWRVVHKWT